MADLDIIDLGSDLTIVTVDPFGDEGDFTVIDLGPAGIVPPVASFHTVSILSQRITSSTGVLQIYRTFGEYVVLTVRSNFTTKQISFWPPIPFLGRIMLVINIE